MAYRQAEIHRHGREAAPVGLGKPTWASPHQPMKSVAPPTFPYLSINQSYQMTYRRFPPASPDLAAFLSIESVPSTSIPDISPIPIKTSNFTSAETAPQAFPSIFLQK